MVRQNKSKVKSGSAEGASVEEVISASDIERYGYCPLNWWQKHQGTVEKGKNLEDGTIRHEKIAKDLESISEKETIAIRSQMGILLFAIIAILLGANGVAIIYFKYISNIHEVAFSYVLLIISILWIALAIIMFVYTMIKDYQAKRSEKQAALEASAAESASKEAASTKATTNLSQTTPPSVAESGAVPEAEASKRSILTRKTVAQWFITVAITLALSGYMLEYPFAPPEVLSRILLAGALVWLLGTSIALFFALRLEEKIKKLESIEGDEMDKKIHETRSHSELLILLFAAGAAILGIAGFIVKYELAFEPLDIFGQIFIILSLVWMSAGFLFFYRSLWGGVITRSAMREISLEISAKSFKPSNIKAHLDALEKGKIMSEEYSVLSMALLAIVLGVNSILIRIEASDIFSRILEIVALIWLLGASLFLYDVLKHMQIANSLRKIYKLGGASIEYTDSMDEQSDLLVSKRHNIRGRPDYIIKREDKIIPVEVKTGRVPRGPHFSHILQLAAYCILVNESYGVRPTHGLIRYGEEKEFRIDFDTELEHLTLEKVNEMRKCVKSGEAHRNHNRKNKCKYCSRRENCPEKLA